MVYRHQFPKFNCPKNSCFTVFECRSPCKNKTFFLLILSGKRDVSFISYTVRKTDIPSYYFYQLKTQPAFIQTPPIKKYRGGVRFPNSALIPNDNSNSGAPNARGGRGGGCGGEGDEQFFYSDMSLFCFLTSLNCCSEVGHCSGNGHLYNPGKR